jgi:hypothetical protein
MAVRQKIEEFTYLVLFFVGLTPYCRFSSKILIEGGSEKRSLDLRRLGQTQILKLNILEGTS